MGSIVYRITLRQPAVFARGDGDANTVDTWNRVPGGAVLGALAARWLKRHPEVQGDAAGDETFRRLFMRGTRFLHAYPEGDPGQRLLPAPLSLYEEKGTGKTGKLWDAAADPDVLSDDEREMQQADLGYLAFSGNLISYRRPEVRTHLHHQQDRAKGRPDTDEGAIYHVESLAVGERFIGVIEVEGQEDERELRALLADGDLSLGRSRGAEYGAQARVEMLHEPKFKEFAPAQPIESDVLVVTLLSEYVGRGEDGSSTSCVAQFHRDLSAALGHPGDWPVAPRDSFVRGGTLSGYVSAWRMPRPAVPVLCAGSVVCYRPSPVPIEQLPAILSIGERQAEGHGRVALGWHGEVPVEGFYEKQPQSIPRERPGHAVADRDANELQQAMLERWLIEQVTPRVLEIRLADTWQPWPSPTALGTARSVLRDQSEDVDFDPHRLPKQVGQAFRRCRVNAPGARRQVQSLFELLNEFADDYDSVQRFLSFGEPRSPLPSFLAQVTLDRPAQRRILRRILDAVLDQARRNAQRKERP